MVDLTAAMRDLRDTPEPQVCIKIIDQEGESFSEMLEIATEASARRTRYSAASSGAGSRSFHFPV
jgi:hypothetical protein